MAATETFPVAPTISWREIVLPKEHGSWSLAFEPVALGLLIAPSMGGAMLAFAIAAAFFARRPLGLILREQRLDRRAAARNAVVACTVTATAFFLAALSFGGATWTYWLIPSAIGGTIFLGFDLRRGGREEMAEVAGAAAFALLPAAFLVLAAGSNVSALAIALIMLGRAVPAVLCVREFLRSAKTGLRRPGVALASSVGALMTTVALARTGLAPWGAVVLLALFTLRTFALLVFPRPVLRARTLGMIEAVAGVLFVVGLSVLWRGSIP